MSTDNPHMEVTSEERCQHAALNTTGFCLGLLRYAREQGQRPEAAAWWIGTLFAPGWEEVRGQGAAVAARLAVLNVISSGVAAGDVSGDEHRAEATVTGWPGEDNLAFMGLSQEEADAVFAVFDPIADSLGLKYEWQRQGDVVTMTLEQGAGSS